MDESTSKLSADIRLEKLLGVGTLYLIARDGVGRYIGAILSDCHDWAVAWFTPQ